MTFDRIWQIMIKEFLELKRDRWARFRLIVPPLVQMLVFGYAATFEVHHVSTVLLDRDHTEESRELVARFTSADRFHITGIAASDAEVKTAISKGDAAVAIVIDAGFSRHLLKGEQAPLQIIVDGTNSNTALIALGYMQLIVTQYSTDAAVRAAQSRTGAQTAISIDVEERPWYNASLNGRWFFIPGVIGTLTLILVVSLTATAIVREREDGTLEQIMVSPIRPAEFILGKTLPFFLIGFADVLLVALFGMAWFQVPFVGSLWLLLLGTTLFLMSCLGLGLLISTLSQTQQQAFASNFLILNPLFTLSGFAFPISSMPPVLQWMTYLNPLRYFLVVIRATFLKAVGLDALWPDMLGMALLGTALLSFSILRFRKSLD